MAQKSTLTIIILMFMLTSCQNINSTKESNVDSNLEAVEIYLNILQNRANFHLGLYTGWPSPQYFQNAYISLDDYLLKIGEKISWEIIEFAVVDMTNSGINDVILSLTHPQIPEDIYLVLIYEYGAVYSNIFTRRNMSMIMLDGIYSRRRYGNWSYAKLTFDSGVFSSEYVSLNYNNCGQSFTVERYNEKGVRWFPFSAGTIKEDFTTVWDLNN